MTDSDELLAIVLDLAEHEPLWSDDWLDTFCSLCDGDEIKHTGKVAHEPSCPWARAVAVKAARET